jgi:pyrroloquinoline quinone biosynthesis protein D
MSHLPERPLLSRRARLAFDRRREQHVLLYPERGLVLNASSASILELCTGERRVGEIVDALASAHPATSREQIHQDVVAFLQGLQARGLLREQP